MSDRLLVYRTMRLLVDAQIVEEHRFEDGCDPL